MPKLYLFPIREESIDSVRRYAEQIVDEIKKSYPLCEYLEDIDGVNIGSEADGAQFVLFQPHLSSAFQINDIARTHRDIRDLVSIIERCLDNKGIKYKDHIELPL